MSRDISKRGSFTTTATVNRAEDILTFMFPFLDKSIIEMCTFYRDA